MRLVLDRLGDTGKQTLGRLTVLSDNNEDVLFSCKTLELSWKENNNNISCIPFGEYDVVPRYSEKYGHHLHILNVPNRSYILIHQGNYYTQIRGCVLVGSDFKDINNDEELDVINSKKTLNNLLNVLEGKRFKLEIC